MSDNTDQQPSSGDQSFLWPSAAHAGGDIADWVSSSQASAAPSTLVGSTAASAYPPAAANPIDGSTAAFPNANHAQVGVAQQIENTWVWQQIENDWQAWRANGGLPAVALHSSGPTTAAAAPLNPNLNARQFEGPAAAALNLSSFTDAAFVPQGVAGTIIDQSDSFAALVDHSVASQDASLHTQPVPPSANIQPLNLPSASQDAIQGTQLGSSSALFGALAVSQGSLNAFFVTPLLDTANLNNNTNLVGLNSNPARPLVQERILYGAAGANSNPPFRCPECQKTFTRPEDLCRHRKSVHDRVRYHCLVEGCRNNNKRGYTRQDSLMRHQNTEH